MTRLAHAICAAVAAVLVWRALAQVWVDETATDAVTAEVLRLAIPAFSAAASALAIAAGAVTPQPRRLFVLDAISWGVLLVIVFALTLGRLDREYIGVLFVLALAAALNAGIARRRTSLVIASVAVSSTQTCSSARHRRTAATAAQMACATRVTPGRLLP